MNYYTLLFVGLISTPAFADITCVSSALIGGHEENPSASITIPNNGSISSSMNCGGYKINIDGDLHVRPHTLSLAIVGPNDNTTSTSTGTELKWVNTSGNGVVVRCSPN